MRPYPELFSTYRALRSGAANAPVPVPRRRCDGDRLRYRYFPFSRHPVCHRRDRVGLLCRSGARDCACRLSASNYDRRGAKAGHVARAFKDDVCARLRAMFICQSCVRLDVRTFSDLESASVDAPVDAGGNLDKSSFTFNSSTQNSIVVRAASEWPIFICDFGFNLASLPNEAAADCNGDFP
jgi:hypothetical protein